MYTCRTATQVNPYNFIKLKSNRTLFIIVYILIIHAANAFDLLKYILNFVSANKHRFNNIRYLSIYINFNFSFYCLKNPILKTIGSCVYVGNQSLFCTCYKNIIHTIEML